MKPNENIVEIEENFYKAQSCESFQNFLNENPEAIVRDKITIDSAVLYYLYFPVFDSIIFVEVPIFNEV